MTKVASPVKVRITLEVTVDEDMWRAEYGQPETSRREIAEAIRADFDAAARNVYPISTFGTMVRVHQAIR